MKPSLAGVFWCLSFVTLEAIQYVYFGGIFQRMSSFLFGFLVFGISATALIIWTALTVPEQLRRALLAPGPLIGANITAAAGWCAYLMSVQLIEPAVAYTVASGVMPLTALLAYRLGIREGEALRNPLEAIGVLILFCAIVFLALETVGGWSGFVRGGRGTAVAGVGLAILDGVLFTWMLIYCQRLDRSGVGATAVFGLRFPLYVATAGVLAMAGIDSKMPLPLSEIAVVIAIGLALAIPPLYALQKAVASISTLTIGALTALGPFMIFAMQMIEGRVVFAPATLAGLFIYFAGALMAAAGAVAATTLRRPAVGD